MMRHRLPWFFANLALMAAPLSAGASGTPNLWTRSSGNLLWSTPANWGNYQTAGSADAAQFDSGAGAAGSPGVLNNVVDVNTTVQQLWYAPVAPAYHTTLINPGVTLSVQDASATGDLLALRLNTVPAATLSHVVIRGAGRLVAGDTNALLWTSANTTLIRVHVPSTLPGPFWATLDMSGLDYFAGAAAEVRVGANGSSAGTQGTWLLAKTNLLLVGSSSTSSTYIGFTIGHTSATADYPSAGDVQLGQENTLRMYSLRVGAMRATNTSLGGPGGGVGGASQAGAGGTMEFQAGLVNPRLVLRGVSGLTAVQNVSIGDNSNLASSSTNTSVGVLDLTGGTVDAQVVDLQLGRNSSSSTAAVNASGSGTLTWTAGTIEVTGSIRVGTQAGNNAGNASGALNVRDHARLKVSGATFNIGGDAGGATGSGNGVVNIAHGGVVQAAGAIAEDNGSGGNGSSTINVAGGYLGAAGTITVDKVNLANGVVSNAGLMTVSMLTGDGTIGGPVTVTGGVVPGVSSIGTLAIFNHLALSTGSMNVFEVDLNTLAADRVAVSGLLTFGGTLLVSNVGGFAAATNGATLHLFVAGSLQGAFSSLKLPTLPAGLAWDTSELASSGSLRIRSEVPVPPRLNVEATGTALNVSWTADRPGWWMEQQTNAPGVGLGTNWHPVPGTHGSNHLTIPINPALGSAFTRLAYQPSMQPLRREAASRRRRIIFNNDGNEPVYQMTQPTVERLLAARTAGLLGSHVDSIFYCPWSSGFSLFTYFTTAGQVMTTREGRYGTNQMPALVEAGIDPLRVMVDYAKQHDLEIFCSFRMNDTHDGSTADYGPPLLRTNTLKQTHPEYLIGTASSKPKHGEWTAVDYGRPEIRELAFRFAEEVCTNYNVDGIEFDFFRHPVFFRSTAAGAVATDADRAAMTALFQRIRQMADNVGRSRARPLLIAMRVPDSVAYCRAMGLDLENWLASDLLDLLVVSGYFQLNDWNYSVALARQYGVKIYPSLDPPNIPNATARALRATELAWRGRAANVWGYGADGVYMFNSFDPASPLWRTLGDPQGLAALDKDFFGSVRGVMVAAGGNLPYASYQTAETLNPSNPKTVAPGASATARINVGDDLSQAGPATLKLRLQFTPAVDPQKLQVTCNAIPLTFLSAQGTWLEYLVSPGDIHRPSNQIKVTLTSDAPQAAWSDLMLELRH